MRDREMKESGGGGNQLFDSRIVMDKPPDISNSDGITNFEFAFNDSNFSDRVLRIEIMAEMPGVSTRSLERDKKEEDFTSCTAEVITIDDKPDLEDNMIYGGHDGESTIKIDESPSADEADRKGDSSWGLCCSTVLKVKSLYVSSAILAAESPFFYKLFSNGMLESDQRQATLQIHESEETAVMDLLSYIYSKKLSSTTVTELLDVLMTADKFEVSSCIRHCSELLCKLPMTLEYALRYLDLPCNVSMASELKSLTDIAKKCLATHYKDITKEEVLQLPLVGIEAILSSETLQVSNEDQVYDFVLKWAQTQYPKGEERRSVLNSLLAQVVHFPYMTCRRLKKALVSNEFDRELASKLVLEALFFKAESSHKQRLLASDSSTNRQYIERPYKYRPVKLVEFESPYQQCIVYLDLKREECANLFPSGRVYSQAFHLAGQGFFLSAHCNIDQQSSTECFGLFLGMQDKAGAKLAVDYEFASRMMPTGEFVNKYKGQYLFTGGKAVGYRNLFAVPWTYFMNEDSPYFINGTLHLRAEMTARQRLLNSANQN